MECRWGARFIGEAPPASRAMRRVKPLVTVALGLAALLLNAAGAAAHVVTADISCTAVTFHCTDFPDANNNTINESVSIDGSLVVATTFSFNGPSGSNTIPISVPPGGHSIAAHADWNTNGESDTFGINKDVSCGSPPPPGPCTVIGSINSNFNGTAVVGVSSGPAFIWFNSNFSVKGMTAGNSIVLTNSRVLINGVPYEVPDARITFANVPCATTSFDTGTQSWITTVPLSGSDEIFLSGLAFPVTNLPGGAKVSWEGTFGTSQPGVCLSWKWGAAAYKIFPLQNTDPLVIDYNVAQIKPTHQASCLYNNGNHAGTPQNPTVQASVTGGARGGGGSNFTGSWSGTGSLCPVCPPELAARLGDSGGLAYSDKASVGLRDGIVAPRVLSLSAARPSPSHGSVSFVVGMPSEGNLRLRIFDVRGRLVATVRDQHESTGWRDLTWNGRSESGRLVPGGIYFAKVELSGRSVTQRFVVAR